jgi:hypothetical protein
MSKSLKFRFKPRINKIDKMIAELEARKQACLETDYDLLGNCLNCGHPIGVYSNSQVLYHIRKGFEYSITCFQCDCRNPKL